MSLRLSVSRLGLMLYPAGALGVRPLQIPFFALVFFLFGLGDRPAKAQADNDRFANREFLSGESFSRVSSTLAATRDGDESASAGAGQDEVSVWWSWQAPREGAVRIHAERENFTWPLRWQVSRGDSLSALAPVADFEQTNQRGAFFRARAGERYEICAIAQGDRPVFFTIHLGYAPAAQARQGLLEGEAVEMEGEFAGATALLELGEADTRRPALYWDWRAPDSGAVHFALHPSSVRAGLRIFEPRPDVGSGGFAALAESLASGELTTQVMAGITYRLVLTATEDHSSGGLARAYATLSKMRFAGAGQSVPLPAGTVLSLVKTNLPGGIEFLSQTSFLTQPGSTLVLTNEPPAEAVMWQPTEGGACLVRFELVDTAGRIWSSAPSPFVTQAPNDDFAKAQVLIGEALVTRVGAGQASLEGEEPPPASGIKQSVWYRWTAPRDGVVNVELMATTGSLERAHVLEVFRGETLAALAALPELNANSRSLRRQRVFAEVRAGDVLRIRVPPSVPSRAREQSLLVRFGDPLTNDAFEARQEITSSPFAGEYEALLAAPQPGEIGPFDRVALRTAWHGWTAPSNGEVRVRTESIDGSWVVPQFFLGDSLAGLKLLSGIEPNFGSPSARDVGFLVDAGSRYALQIDSQPQSRFDTSSPARFTFEFIPPPENDEITNALPVSGDRWRVSGTLRGARGETNAPIGVRAGAISPRRPGNRAVWHQWTAPRSGPFSLAIASSNHLNALVFAANGFGPDSIPVAVATRSSTANFAAASNRVYWIAAAMPDAAFGASFVLHLFPGLPPENDDFARATVLSGLAPSFEASFERASGEPGDPLSRSLWWVWTAPVSGWARLGPMGNGRAAVTTRSSIMPWVAHPVTMYSFGWRAQSQPVGYAGFACEAGASYRIGLERADAGGVLEFELDVTTWRASEPSRNQVFGFGELAALTYPSPDPAIDGLLRSPASLQWATNGYRYLSEVAFDSEPVQAQVAVTEPAALAILAATNHQGRLRVSQPLPLRARPMNDDFVNAAEIDPSGAEALRVTVGLASREPGEPVTSAGTDAGSRWWHWTPAYSGEIDWTPAVEPLRADGVYGGAGRGLRPCLGWEGRQRPLGDRGPEDAGKRAGRSPLHRSRAPGERYSEGRHRRRGIDGVPDSNLRRLAAMGGRRGWTFGGSRRGSGTSREPSRLGGVLSPAPG